MSPAVCSVCLAGNLTLKCVENIELQNIFEKLTCLKMSSECGEMALCFLCYRQLQRCRRFADAARRSRALLADLFHRGLEATEASLAASKVAPTATLRLSTVPAASAEVVHHTDLRESLKTEVVEPEAIEDSGTADTPAPQKEGGVQPPEEPELIEDISDPGSVPTEKRRAKPGERDPDERKRRLEREPPRCEFCAKTFSRASALVAHRRTHTGDRPFACEACRKAFASASNLRAHMHTHVPLALRELKFPCGACARSFSRRDLLRLHARTHAARTHACRCCDKRFATATRLREHLRTHSADRPHACDRCAKTFKTRGVLRDHLLAHSGVRAHACASCDRRFARKHELTLHARAHSGSRPHACAQCGKRFSQAASLRAHGRTHSEERPFACAICARAFKDKYALARHASAHAAGPPCACAVCGRECASRRAAQAHARAHAHAPVGERGAAPTGR